jgi:hypothetical protein
LADVNVAAAVGCNLVAVEIPAKVGWSG